MSVELTDSTMQTCSRSPDLVRGLPIGLATSTPSMSDISAATLEISSNVVLAPPIIHSQRHIDGVDVIVGHTRSILPPHRANTQHAYLLDNENTNSNAVDSNDQMEYHFNPLYTISDASQQNTQPTQSSALRTSRYEPSVVEEHPYASTLSSSPPSEAAPADVYNLFYLSIVIAGISYLLPYYCYILSGYYFVLRYDKPTIGFTMNFVYILMSLIAVLVSNLAIESWPLLRRLRFGYLLCLVTLVMTLAIEILFNLGSYPLLLVFVGAVGVGSTLQQSTFYGYASMLPRRYTQALMTGESAAGVFQTLIFLLMKIAMERYYHLAASETIVVFYLGSIVLVFAAYVFHTSTLPRTPFIRFYLQAAANRIKRDSRAEEARVLSQINENVNLVNMYSARNSINANNMHDNLSLDNDLIAISTPVSRRASLSRDVSILPSSGRIDTLLRTSSNDSEIFFGIDEEEHEEQRRQRQQQVMQPQSVAQSEKHRDNDGESEFRTRSSTTILVSVLGWLEMATHGLRNLSLVFQQFRESDQVFKRFKVCMLQRYYTRKAIAIKIWPHLLSVAMIYFVTLNLVPGIIMEIETCRFRDWTPLLLFSIFTCTDFAGKLMAPFFYHVNTKQMLCIAFIRFGLIFLVSLCVMPEYQFFYDQPFWPSFFIAILGITNGIFGALPMILAPNNVPEASKEMAGNLMTAAYIFGLASGSLTSFSLNDIISGDRISMLVCSNHLDHQS